MKSDSKIRQFCCKQIFLCYNGVGEIFMEFESIAKVSIEALNDYIAEGHVYEIMIKDPECYPRGKSYDVFALLTMKRAMAEFLKGCPARNSNDPNNEINIFTYIYTKLAYLAEHEERLRESKRSKSGGRVFATDYIQTAAGLGGALLENADFAEVLRNLLAEKGIESKYISGWKRKSADSDETIGHSWNQVKINGEWFNCDISCDRQFITEELIAPMFLKSNEEFSQYLRYPDSVASKTEEAQRSVSNSAQEILIRRCRDKIINEIYPNKRPRSKKKGFFATISENIRKRRMAEKGEV